ncbi:MULTISPECIES: hypothetical protein [Pandoraea]|uniref:hypothetical protein n=1 Tax=Pandoraea TaxID=93217 RepID=UPI001F5CCC9D|nr:MULTISPECIES: hypothetical protein [Pandoraea]MCI3205855.1 hypothetical protein [Pandoraea sp. LA3]MDN4583883.1 hypothetical protein [Pandoraea capi]
MSNNIATVRQALIDTLADLRSTEKPMEVDRARAVADVARVLVDTAKVEVDYLRVTGQETAPFLDSENKPALPQGITGVHRHTLR